MKTKTISQTVSFKATPLECYKIFLNPKKYAAMVGARVALSSKINGRFEIFDGYCHGYNIELKEGKKIVQAWHFAEEGWPDDHFSICTFAFEKIPTGTKLKFQQSGVPEDKVNTLKEGWKKYYWQPMEKFLAKTE